MARKRRSDLTRARAEAAALLRLDLKHLSPVDTLKCDIVASLRLVIDNAQADVLDGSSADLGKLLVAVETLTKLLPAERVEPAAVGASDARARILQMILNAQAADAIEQADAEQEEAEAEQTALQAAEARIASLEDEVRHLRGSKPRMLPPPSAKPLKATKSTAKAEKPATTEDYAAKVERLRQQYAPNQPKWVPPGKNEPVQAKPGWLTKIEAQLANAAARAATAVEMTAPGRAWEAQPSTGNAYAAAYGAWGGDGLGAQGWIDKLNRRTW